MQKKTHSLAAVSLCAVLTLSPLVPTAAAASVHPAHATEAAINLMVDPRYDHMSRISSSLSVDALGRANCTGSYTTYDDFDGTITLTLQQNKSGKWVDIKEWSEDYIGTGVKALDKGYYVDSGYRYRLVTVVQIWDTDGTELEKVSCDSPIYEY